MERAPFSQILELQRALSDANQYLLDEHEQVCEHGTPVTPVTEVQHAVALAAGLDTAGRE